MKCGGVCIVSSGVFLSEEGGKMGQKMVKDSKLETHKCNRNNAAWNAKS